MCPLSLLSVPNNVIHALIGVAQDNDTLKTLDALVIIDSPILANGINAAAVTTVLTGLAAAFNPIKPAE